MRLYGTSLKIRKKLMQLPVDEAAGNASASILFIAIMIKEQYAGIIMLSAELILYSVEPG
ncbi:hypothetical protein GBAR_LOCUS7517 [Geodia barretti]|uniref:Uncharacterized protein n=1 Tax=Geodia barretti TaxID=519541 RepID=A0AA35RKF8_GEOBA|nr:hypothetical protein GBAR_LOCUS7517 [Geodia barretti]